MIRIRLAGGKYFMRPVRDCAVQGVVQAVRQ
jgi:hypothetical protein